MTNPIQREAARVAPGYRVGCVVSANVETKRMEMFGYGTFQSYGTIPADLKGGIYDMVRSVGYDGKIAVLKLDNGKLVYGCECWWGPEDRIKGLEARFAKVVVLDIDKERAKAMGAKPADTKPAVKKGGSNPRNRAKKKAQKPKE